MKKLEWLVACFAGVIAVAFLADSCLRAYLLSFTHDESMTYIYHVLPGVIGALDFSVANNHFLNSLLMQASSSLFGTREFALRLPNLAAHALFLIGSYLALRRLSTPLTTLCGFVIVNMNLLLLEFFSLARGYGIGLAFVMWSVLFYLRSAGGNGDEAKRGAVRAIWCAWGAVLANLSFLNYYIGLVVTHLVLDSLSFRRNGSQALSAVLSRNRFLVKHVLLLLICVFPMAWEMTRGNELYFGGTTGFWSDTVNSLIHASRYDCFLGKDLSGIVLAIILVTLVGAVAIAVSGMKKWNSDKIPVIFLLLVIVISGISTVLQHYVLGTRFLIERTAILFPLLFSVLFVSVLGTLAKARSAMVKSAGMLLLVVPTMGTLVHTTSLFDVKASSLWAFDANTKEMMEDLVNDHAAMGGKPSRVRLGVNWLFEPSVNYYRITQNVDWLAPVTREPLFGKFDYYFYAHEDSRIMSSNELVTLRIYLPTRNVLARSVAGHRLQ